MAGKPRYQPYEQPAAGWGSLISVMRHGFQGRGLAAAMRVLARQNKLGGVVRRMSGFRVVPYDVPAGCCAAYFPECNALIPLWQHDEKSKTPASKSVPVRLCRDAEVEALPV